MRKNVNRQIVLTRRPDGMVSEDCFQLVEGDMPVPGPGQALVKVLCVSIDPAIRGWIDARGSGYLPMLELGDPVRSNGAGVVIESRSEHLPLGSLVTVLTGWQEYALAGSEFSDMTTFATPLPEGSDPVGAVSIFGQVAATAYAAVERVAPPVEGESYVVSAAASAVGSLVAQLAKLRGARVIGIAGSPAKCRWLTEEAGLDACIDYKREDVAARLKELCPKGVNTFFDNVGGELLDNVLRRLAHKARVVLCGSLSTDNASEPYGLRHYDRLMSRRAQMVGMNVMDHWDLFPEALKCIGEGLESGQLKHRIHMLEGLESAPEGLGRLYRGDHLGKLVVRVADEPSLAAIDP